MAGVRIDTGPIDALDRAADVPRNYWGVLTSERKVFAKRRLPHDCRALVKFAKEAEEMWQPLGYASYEAYFRDGLGIDFKLAKWAIDGLQTLDPSEPIPVLRAVEAGQRLAQRGAEAVPLLPQCGGRKQADNLGVAKVVTNAGTTAAYLLSRIARDAPEVMERVKAGEFRSARAAARAAGIVREPTLMERAQRLCKRLSEAERAELRAWLDTLP